MKNQDKAVKVIILTLCLIVAVAALTGFVLLGAYGYGICAIISAACSYGIYRNKKPVTVVHFTGVLILSSSLLFTQAFKGIFPWQYSFQKYYAEKAGGFDTTDFFPDKLDFYSGSYRSEFVPSMMLESGWFVISFDTNSIDDYKEYCLYNCKTHFPALELNSNYSESTTAALEEIGYSTNSRLYIKTPDDISDSAVLYLFYSNFDRNHPHSKAVIIDETRIHFIVQ